MEIISIHEYLTKRKALPLFDVRSPIEFLRGHIPGAVNLPLFTDNERAHIGLTFKEKGQQVAIDEGLSIAGAKMRWYVKQLKELTPDREIAIHCWRGGRRSSSLAWLFSFVGYKVYVIEKGYKAYRNYVLKMIDKADLDIIVLGGKTGSAKTAILQELANKGEQIIDLEALANHKGSAFGGITEDKQPSTEYFENLLHRDIYQLDLTKRVWIENESRGIGQVFIPEPFWIKMKNAPLVHIEIPQHARARYLANTYGKFNKQELKSAFNNIKKRLGGKALNEAIEYVDKEEYTAAAVIALNYYDKTYQYGLDNNRSPDISILNFDDIDIPLIAGSVLRYVKKGVNAK